MRVAHVIAQWWTYAIIVEDIFYHNKNSWRDNNTLNASYTTTTQGYSTQH